jgi:hypothetical protein
MLRYHDEYTMTSKRRSALPTVAALIKLKPFAKGTCVLSVIATISEEHGVSTTSSAVSVTRFAASGSVPSSSLASATVSGTHTVFSAD